MKHIFKCTKCGRYTLKEKCVCGGRAISPKPPKWSPEDKWSGYRRKAKEQELKTRKLT